MSQFVAKAERAETESEERKQISCGHDLRKLSRNISGRALTYRICPSESTSSTGMVFEMFTEFIVLTLAEYRIRKEQCKMLPRFWMKDGSLRCWLTHSLTRLSLRCSTSSCALGADGWRVSSQLHCTNMLVEWDLTRALNHISEALPDGIAGSQRHANIGTYQIVLVKDHIFIFAWPRHSKLVELSNCQVLVFC